MNRSFLRLIAVVCNLLALNVGHAETVAAFTNQFKSAQLIQDNAVALNFRLALLDNAAAGSQVRITTYTYDFGASTRALAAHMCSAVARGVKIELIVDSKSGEILGEQNPFNATPAAKQTEQAYVNLANCGVKIYIHNYTTDYVTISLLGKRIPNIFGNAVKAGDSVNPLTADTRLTNLRRRLTEALRPTLAAQNLKVDTSNVLYYVEKLASNIALFLTNYTPGRDIEPTVDAAHGFYTSLLDDPFWMQFDPQDSKTSVAKMKIVNSAIVSALEKDAVLKMVRDKFRVFNRLNHRKLFMVQEPGGQNCVIIGGRNLGDLYLTNGPGTYRDGDVFFCTQQVPTLGRFIDEANVSLDALKNDLSDKALSATASSVVKFVNPTKKITLGPKVAAVDFKNLKGDDLGAITDPILLTSSWNSNGAADQVRMALIEAILRERKEIYIETAYAEFDAALREALETAMKTNKVKVHIVTNSLFISDAESRMIRLWMAKWNETMKAQYPDLFEIDFAPLSAGHMIHFKGAGFRCQEGLDKSFYREYIVGSHNFHPRSGYSDKEHAIEWREPVDASCPDPDSDLIALRMGYYKDQRALNQGPVLRIYKDLLEELNEVSNVETPTADSDLAKVIIGAMYQDGQLVRPDRLDWVQYLLDQSGLRDLIGILL